MSWQDPSCCSLASKLSIWDMSVYFRGLNRMKIYLFKPKLTWYTYSVLFFQARLILQVDKKARYIDSIVEKRVLIFLFRYFAIDACGGWDTLQRVLESSDSQFAVRISSERWDEREQGGSENSDCTELITQASIWELSCERNQVNIYRHPNNSQSVKLRDSLVGQ